MKKFRFAIAHAHKLFVCISLFIALLSCNLFGEILYTLTDLAAGHNGTSIAYSINNDGIAVGAFNSIACKFDNGLFILGTLEGYTKSFAYSINNSGQIVGWVETTSANRKAANFSTAVPQFISTAKYSIAIGISDSGRIVGISNGSSNYQAYDFTVEQSLGSLGGTNSWALGINSSGIVVGAAQDVNGIYKPTKFDTSNIALSEKTGWAYAINNNADADIVGAINDENGYRAYNFTSDTELGTLGGTNSVASSVNDFGIIVGYAQDKDNNFQACLFDQLQGALNLNLLVDAPGWNLQYAYDINNNGWIVGSGIFEGTERAFLLKPIPEPATVAVLMIGLGLIPLKRSVKR